MKQYFISKNQKQYRANLHAHTRLSDGHSTPEELKNEYKKAGYSILAITDHEFPRNHSSLTDPDFLMITGYEAYLRPDSSYIYDPFTEEVHFNLFAKEPDNEALICYNKRACKYFAKNGIDPDTLHRVGSERPREYSVEYANEFIRTAVANGYLVSYNHPVWSMENEERILSYENIFSLEIDNYGAFLSNNLEHSGALYDKMLRRRMHVFCHGGDDNHNSAPFSSPRSDSFGAWTMILADELTYPSVIRAMESGSMYSSTGPLIHEISFEDGVVRVESSPAKKIIVHMGSKAPAFEVAEKGRTISSAELPLSPIASYFRVSVIDENGRIASSRGFFRSEYEL